jgi:hypothetical protein
VYVKHVDVPLEQLFKYLSDESSSEDEEWTEGPIDKKDDPNASKGKQNCRGRHVLSFLRRKQLGDGFAILRIKNCYFKSP